VQKTKSQKIWSFVFFFFGVFFFNAMILTMIARRATKHLFLLVLNHLLLRSLLSAIRLLLLFNARRHYKGRNLKLKKTLTGTLVAVLFDLPYTSTFDAQSQEKNQTEKKKTPRKKNPRKKKSYWRLQYRVLKIFIHILE